MNFALFIVLFCLSSVCPSSGTEKEKGEGLKIQGGFL